MCVYIYIHIPLRFNLCNPKARKQQDPRKDSTSNKARSSTPASVGCLAFSSAYLCASASLCSLRRLAYPLPIHIAPRGLEVYLS